MGMPGRRFDAGSGYRYGFNGKEDDKDISEGGQDYGMRIYDLRLGRFLSVDPLTRKYPELSSYQFASNRPIDGIDKDGLEFTPSNSNNELGITLKLTIVNYSDVVTTTHLQQIGALIKEKFETEFSKPAVTVYIDGLPITLPKITAKMTIQTLNSIGSENNSDLTNKIGKEYQKVNQGYGIILELKDKTTTEFSDEGGSSLDFSGKSQHNILKAIVSYNSELRENKDIVRSAEHEIGHDAGLPHTWLEKDIKSFKQSDKSEIKQNKATINNNAMNSAANPESKLRSTTGTNLLYPQIAKAWYSISKEYKDKKAEVAKAVSIVANTSCY